MSILGAKLQQIIYSCNYFLKKNIIWSVFYQFSPIIYHFMHF